MTEILVIGLLDATHEGPVSAVRADGEDSVVDPDPPKQPVALSQGSLDGACGPYCLFMALLICGVVEYARVVAFDPSLRGDKVSKLFDRMSTGFSTLFTEGSDLSDLRKLLRGVFPKVLGIKAHTGGGAATRAFVEEEVRQGRPVILGIDWPGGGHWVVVVGLEYERYDDDSRKLCRFLILDPGDPPPTVCSWNGVIDARGSGGAYPYTWWTADGRKVKLSTALSMWPK